VIDIFWKHPDVVKLLNSFNIVIMMANTYKANRYKMPLLEIVGVTSTRTTFFVAFVLLAYECENNFILDLERLKGLFLGVNLYLRILVSDKDIVLVNSIKVLFLEACNMLCHFHIDKNVKANHKMLLHPREAQGQVMHVKALDGPIPGRRFYTH